MSGDDLIGLELDDKFRLVKQIGEGGMGSVFEAEDFVLDRMVAVKLVQGRDGDAQLKERFVKEIKAASKIEHPNLVPVFTAGYDKGFLYLAMRLIKGWDLARILIEGYLEVDRALKIFEDVARGLECIHQAGYVHRDVKPANILVAEVGKPSEYALLGDLGIAKALDDPGGITKGQPPGTPLYMAPETFEHWIADARSDQYSLACVLFEMLAGRPPFYADELGEIANQHVEAPPPDIAVFNPGVPDNIRVALNQALSKVPAERFASISKFYDSVRDSIDEEAPDFVNARKLTPVEISRSLFGLAPDRDERSSQLAMETFLTLWANDYEAPQDQPKSPKRRNGALRSLILGENFLEGFKDDGEDGRRAEAACRKLAAGADFAGSDSMGLAQQALRALIDDRTLQGSSGATLLTPFHESMLWYDARRSGAKRPWSVRKVNMRGTGVTLGAMLLHADASDGNDAPNRAVEGIRTALKAPSPLEQLAGRLQEAVPDELDKFKLEPDEREAWKAADSELLRSLSARVNRHCANITAQTHVAPSTKLLQVRLILALDLAHHALVRSWEAIDAPPELGFLLLAFSSEERKENDIRIASEGSYQSARQEITQAIIAELALKAEEIAEMEDNPDWDLQFESRAKLGEIAGAFADASDPSDFQELAGLVFEESRGAGYSRPVDAFRVLLESVGLLNGTGQYRYLRAGPDLLAALIGAVDGMPMPTASFLDAIWREWSFVVGEKEMTHTSLVDSLDGSLLARNTRILERILVSSGLAVALSDQTCMVGRHLGEFK
jgi:serine/threonine protein kinase